MRTIELIEGVTLTATEKTLRKAQELVNYYVNQAALLDELNRAWEMGSGTTTPTFTKTSLGFVPTLGLTWAFDGSRWYDASHF